MNNKNNLLGLILVIMSFFGSTTLFAQPANDNCANAATIPPSAIGGPCINGNNTLATIEAFEAGTGPAGLGCWASAPDNTVWYKITVPNTANYRFRTTPVANDTQLKLLAGTCGSFSTVACNEDANGNLGAEVSAVLNAGSTYYIQVDYWDIPGPFCLGVDSTSVTGGGGGPSTGNNNCVFDAIDLTAQVNLIHPNNNPFDCYQYTYSSATDVPTATNVVGSATVPCDGGTDMRDRWFKFTVSPSTPPVWIDVYRIGTLDYTAALYSGNPGGTCPGPITGLTYIDCSDGISPGGPRDKGNGTTPIHSRIDCSNLPAGTYYYRVWEWGGGAPTNGTFSICIEYGLPVGVTSDGCPPPPTIGKTCGIPNTNVLETYPKLANVGCTGNANNTNTNEPQVGAGTGSGQFDENCDGSFLIPVAYVNNVINNTAIYAFQLNATAPCQAAPTIRLSNMEYGGTPGNVAQITVQNSLCAGSATSVMNASTGANCIVLKPYTGFTINGEVPMANGTYYLVIDGQDGQLIQYDLTLEIKHVGVGCVPNNNNPSQPIAMGASRCGPGTVNLSASGCNNGTLKWYSQANGGTALAQGATFTTPSINSTTPYYVSCTVGTCESARTLVYATVVNPPTITALDTTICSGSTVTLTTQVSDPGGTYLWSPGGQTTPSRSASPSTTTNYTVQYTKNGCTVSDVSTVTVNPAPTVTSTNTTICQGGSGTLTATGNPTGGTFLWNPGAVAGNTLTASPTSTTNYTVTYTRNGCSASNTGTITVSPVPTATMSGGGNICQGQTATITVNFTGAGPYNLTYTNGATNTTVNNISANPYTFNTGTAGNYSITAFSNSNCTGTSSGSATVTVASPITTSNLQHNCVNGNTQYTVSFQINGGSPGTYNVTGGTGGTVSASAPYIFTSNPINNGTTYNFSITDANNCAPVTVSGSFDCNCPASATISGGGSFCQGSGNTVNVNVSLVGTGPFDFTYNDGTNNIPVTNYNGPSPYVITTSTPGTYTLVGMNDATCAGSVSGSATVTQTPTPVFSVADTTICNGGTATLTAVPSVSGGTFQWTAPASVAGSTNPSVSDSPTANTQYDVTYTLNGCSSSESALVTVNPIPTVSVSSSTICEGDQATITANGGNGTGSYLWTAPSSVANQTTATVTDSPTSTTDYFVTYTQNGCSNSASGTVTVNPTPSVTISPQDPTICEGNNVTLQAISSLTGGTYAWTPGGQTTQSITVSPNSTTTYSVEHTVNGCTSAPASSTVTVNPTPVATAGNNSPICEGQTLNLSANTVAGASYQWNGPGGYSSTNEDPTRPNATPNMSGQYVLVITNNGCSSAPSVTSVTVNPTQDATINAAGPFCDNENATNLVAATPGGTWSGNGITNANTGTFDPSLAGAGSHTISYTSAGTCSTTDTETITVIASPILDVQAASTVGCNPMNVAFDLTVQPAGSLVQWDLGDGTTVNSNTDINHVYQLPGLYTVDVTASSNGCSSNLLLTNYITVNETPTASFSVGISDLTVELNNQSSGADTYLWSFGDGNTSTEANPSHTYTNAGEKTVIQLIAFSAEGCSDTTFQEIVLEEEIIFFIPNAFTPDGDMINQYFSPVITSGIDVSTYEFKIFNRWGELVFVSNDVNLGWDGTFGNIQVPEGLYTWTLKFSDKKTDNKYTYKGGVTILR